MSDRHVHLIQRTGMDFPAECRACFDRAEELDRLQEENERLREALSKVAQGIAISPSTARSALQQPPEQPSPEDYRRAIFDRARQEGVISQQPPDQPSRPTFNGETTPVDYLDARETP